MSETITKSPIPIESANSANGLVHDDSLEDTVLADHDQTNHITDKDKKEFIKLWQSLEPEFCSAVELIKEDILNGRWTEVVADDTRGRFPAMVLRGVISRAYKAVGRDAIPLVYLAGSRWTALEQSWYREPTEDSLKVKKVYDEYLGDIKAYKPEGRRLVVTERVSMGRNLTAMVRMMAENDIKCDVLSFASNSSGQSEVQSEMLKADVESKFYNVGYLPKEGMNVDRTMDWVSHGQIDSFTYPINKTGVGLEDWQEFGLHDHKGRHIPVGGAKTDSEEYILWRQLANNMAERIYGSVFIDKEP